MSADPYGPALSVRGVEDGPCASAQDVVAAEPILRRVIGARVSESADVDDLVHDGLEKLLRARHRLAPDALVPYAVVVAQNLVASRARQFSRRNHIGIAPTISEGAPDPEEAALATESQEALRQALAAMDPQERTELLAYQERHYEEAKHERSSAGLRVRMARSRGKLRVEYLLAVRKTELPTPTCHKVLLAISSGDARRQHALGVGDHLLECETCAELSVPLANRRLGLTVVAIPVALAARLVRHVRAHPVSSTVAVGAATGAIAAGIAYSAVGRPATPPAQPVIHSHPVTSAPTTTVPVTSSTTSTTSAANSFMVPGLSAQGMPIEANGSLTERAGSPVMASSVLVQAVATHNGFWVGTSTTDRIWVELVGPLRDFQIVPGDRLNFTGAVVAQAAQYPEAIGVLPIEGAAQLSAEGAHIEVPTSEVTITASP